LDSLGWGLLARVVGRKAVFVSTLNVTFRERPTDLQYAKAVLACQLALILVGLGELATVWPDGTADDQQINALSDRWLATNPWSD
jgi:hypothetical protein